ncbi:MAG: acetyl-CoA carboxylase biotin carboxyl carrier protein subunit [Bacteroidales bacterium]
MATSGIIVSIAVKPGDRVTKGQKLLLMEAMKMENRNQGRLGW